MMESHTDRCIARGGENVVGGWAGATGSKSHGVVLGGLFLLNPPNIFLILQSDLLAYIQGSFVNKSR